MKQAPITKSAQECFGITSTEEPEEFHTPQQTSELDAETAVKATAFFLAGQLRWDDTNDPPKPYAVLPRLGEANLGELETDRDRVKALVDTAQTWFGGLEQQQEKLRKLARLEELLEREKTLRAEIEDLKSELS